jgi:hypothetical protein
MKTKFALGAVVAAIAVFSQTAFAQATATPASGVSRDQRKAETAAANKAGKLTPAGEGTVAPAPGKTSETTRDARKAQTQADAKSGKLAPAGEAGVQKADKADATKPSQTTREARKAQTEADRKAGKLTPAGEGAAMK